MYTLDGRQYTPSDPLFQDALAIAHVEHRRPHCSCTDSAAPMYVARATGTFAIKRMPYTGHLHAPGCPHHSSNEYEQSETVRPAIERDPRTGQVRIRAGFAMSSGSTHTATDGDRHHHHQEAHRRLTLHALVIYLWNRAELTAWRPGFVGKRNWAVVRYRVLRAAQDVWVNGALLAHALFIPEPFSVERAQDIRDRRLERFARGFGNRTGTNRRMLLIGEVKDLATSAPKPHVVIKHLPDTTVRLPALWRDASGKGHDPREGAAPHRVMCATVDLNAIGELVVRELQIVSMSQQWRPIAEATHTGRRQAPIAVRSAWGSPATTPPSNP